MERDLISKTTSSDFFTKEGLKKLAGINDNIDYVMVIIKELVDNSLDEVEQKENGIIEVTICEKLCVWEIKIKDNGRGIPEKNIDNLINLTKDSRYSTKREYISPTRGCQGNAMKTIIGIPCALGIENNQINIIAQGIKHQINAVIYPNNSVEIVNNKIIVGDTIGTEIIVNIPTNIFYKNYHNIEQNSDNVKRQIIRHLEAIALFNPHITLGVKIEEVNDKNNHDKLTVSYQKNYPQRVEKIIKRNISSDIDIHWYSRIDFEKLAWGLIHEHPEKLLYKSSNKSNAPTFLGIFEKLSSRAKQTSVLGDYANHFKKMGDFKNLSIEEVNFILGEIYSNAKDETKPLKSSCLGCVGDYLKHEYSESYYKKINIGEDFIFEVFICKADNQFV